MPTTPTPAGVEIDGARLRELRKLGGDTLKSFSEKCDVGFRHLSQIERGRRPRVRPPTFVRICNALGIPEDKRESMLSDAA